MAERLAYLEAVVGADVTQFRKGMRDVRNEVGFLSETVKGLAGIGRSLTFAFTTPIVALGTASIGAASQFEASMYNINAIAGLTGAELDDLSRRALEFGANTRSGAQEAADALYTVFSAGLTDVEDAFSAMEVATYTAEAGLADLTTTTESMLSVMLSYGDTSEEMAWRTSNAITQMVAIGVGSMEEFAGALGNVVPTAQGLGMSIEELMGDMAFLTQRGLSAAKAGTALNSALTALIKPSEAMSAAMHELGAGSSQELIENFGGVNGAIEALIEHADGSQEALAAMFGNIRGLRAINLFAGDVDAWNASMAEFNASMEGATMRAWEQQMMSFSASWDMLVSAVQGAAIVVGNTMLPVLKPLVDGLRDFVLTIMDVSPELLSMAVGFTAVAAAAPPLLWLIASMVSPFGVLLGLIAGIGVAVTTNFMGARDTIANAANGIIASLEPLIGTLTDFWGAIFPPELELSVPTITGELPDPFKTVNINPPLGGAVSLWDYYEGEGFIETTSWEDFMALATEGGWEGGAITSDAPVTIQIPIEGVEFTGTVEPPEIAMGELRAEEMFGDSIAPELFTDRLQGAFAQFAPILIADLEVMFAEVLTWLDGKGAEVLTSITGWFTELDSTAIYDAFTGLLSGEAVLSDFLPFTDADLQTEIEGLGVGITNALPKLTVAFGTLFTDVGAWLVSDGVPLLSRSVGYLVGRVGVLISQGIASLGAMLMGGGAADGMSAFGETVATPFGEGFEDAMEDADVTSGLGQMMAGIAGGLALLATVGTFLPVVWAIQKAIKMGSAIAGWVQTGAKLMTPLANAMRAYVAGGGLSRTWTGLATLFDRDLAAASGRLGTPKTGGRMVSSISAAMTTAASAVSSTTAWVVSAASSIGGAIMSAVGAVLASPIAMGLILGTAVYLMIPDETIAGWREDIATAFDSLGLGMTYDDMMVTLNTVAIDVSGAVVDMIVGDGLSGDEAAAAIWDDVDLSSWAEEAGLIIDLPPIGDGSPIVVEPDSITVTPQAVDMDLTGISMAFADDLLAGGDVDTIIAEQFVPLEAAWVAMFGEGGTMPLAFGVFSDSTTLGFAEVGIAATNMAAIIAEQLPPITPIVANSASQIVKEMRRITTVFDRATGMVMGFVRAIQRLALVTTHLRVEVALSGEMSGGVPDGSHAMGLPNVPFDGYLAELHKGERVLTAAENKDYGKVSNYATTGGATGSTTNVTTNQISITGIQDVDGIIRDLQRRGIDLDG